MPYSNQKFTTPQDALTHHGVKGMKWGVRKQAQLTEARKIASGNATKLDKAAYLTRVNAGQLIVKGFSLKKVAKAEVKSLEIQKARIEAGKANIGDKLERAMTTPIPDLIRGR